LNTTYRYLRDNYPSLQEFTQEKLRRSMFWGVLTINPKNKDKKGLCAHIFDWLTANDLMMIDPIM
jgi:hypothetical protein